MEPSMTLSLRTLTVVVFTTLAACSSTPMGDDAPTLCQSDDDCAAGTYCTGGLCTAPVDGGVDASGTPDLAVAPGELDFGSPAIGVRLVLELTLRNVGSAPLIISRLEVIESDTLVEYSTEPAGEVDLELAPGTEATVAVTLVPEDAEADVAELRVHSNDPDAPLVAVPLTSEVKGAPALTVTPDAVDFGVIDWGDAPTADVTVENSGTGNAPIELRTVTVTDTTGLGAVYTLELALIDPITGAESRATPPLFLAPGAARVRARITVDTMTLGSGPIPAEVLLFTTDLTAPADAERRVPLAGAVLGCAMPADETCDGTDEDCDLEVDDGNPGGGVVCATGLLGICETGTTVCERGALGCVPDLAPTAEVCDGIDSNCDSVVDGGLVQICSLGCADGVEFCVAGAWIGCTAPAPAAELCNGLDDDCNAVTSDGTADPSLGTACDGADSDLCTEGTRACTGGALVCVEAAGDALDLCNGIDDDCNAATTDGSGEPTLGTACDGADSDLCAEGTFVCSAGTLGCTDGGPDRMDLCNGLDDDCDPASADGSEDPGFGVACDGADSDLCAEGTRVCTAGALTCNDATASALDLCNGLDDDCDPASADGTEDPGFGYTYRGADQTFTLPVGCSSFTVKMWGAGGGAIASNRANGSSGGGGGFAQGTLSGVAGGTSFIVKVGGQGGAGIPGCTPTPAVGGWPGGGNAGGWACESGSGGGYSGLMTTGGVPIIISGAGGGGVTLGLSCSPQGAGGAGGGVNGIAGGDALGGTGGGGGTQTTGGTAGSGGSGGGSAGSFLRGAAGAMTGGGGGGYYGGGSGGATGGSAGVCGGVSYTGGGSGGGSGYVGGTGSYIPTITLDIAGSGITPANNVDPAYISGIGVGGVTPGTAGGNGYVVITYP